MSQEHARPLDDDLTYMAEEDALTDLCFTRPAFDGCIDPEAVVGFMVGVATAAGWSIESPPIVNFDHHPDSHRNPWAAAYVGGDDQVIHFDPAVLDSVKVLHELAHWIDQRGGHNDRFRANLVTLWEAAWGAGDLLLTQYIEHGLAVDEGNLP